MSNFVEIKDLKKYFLVSGGKLLKAVDGISLDLLRGEIVGVVGESGCGKTTLGRTVVGLYRPTAGRVVIDGINVHTAAGELKRSLPRRVQMIFQDPYSSLNPRMTAGEIIGEALDLHRLAPGEKRRERIEELLYLVGLNQGHAGRFPHQLSGGQRQRIGIARALAVKPQFLVCDEPVSALDVSIRAQVINLLEDLQEKLKLTVLFIAHDLSVVRHISSRVAVMYLGRVVEMAETEELFSHPLHPYTRLLLSAIPELDPEAGPPRPALLTETHPAPTHPQAGCAFSGQCPQAPAECRKSPPVYREAVAGHFVACHLV